MDIQQKCINLMGETLYDQFMFHMNNGNEADALALGAEWVVDGDPEDGEYEFTFINDITNLS
jgi:hypothetical protein